MHVLKLEVLGPNIYTIFPIFFPGKRQDEDLIEAWRKIKEKQGVDFNVLFDKSDLDRWDHSDFALGLFSMSDMDYVRIHHMFLRFPNLRFKKKSKGCNGILLPKLF